MPRLNQVPTPLGVYPSRFTHGCLSVLALVTLQMVPWLEVAHRANFNLVFEPGRWLTEAGLPLLVLALLVAIAVTASACRGWLGALVSLPLAIVGAGIASSWGSSFDWSAAPAPIPELERDTQLEWFMFAFDVKLGALLASFGWALVLTAHRASVQRASLVAYSRSALLCGASLTALTLGSHEAVLSPAWLPLPEHVAQWQELAVVRRCMWTCVTWGGVGLMFIAASWHAARIRWLRAVEGGRVPGFSVEASTPASSGPEIAFHEALDGVLSRVLVAHTRERSVPLAKVP